MSEQAIKNGVCPKCRGKRVIVSKGKSKRVTCPACKGLGIKVDVLF